MAAEAFFSCVTRTSTALALTMQDVVIMFSFVLCEFKQTHLALAAGRDSNRRDLKKTERNGPVNKIALN